MPDTVLCRLTLNKDLRAAWDFSPVEQLGPIRGC